MVEKILLSDQPAASFSPRSVIKHVTVTSGHREVGGTAPSPRPAAPPSAAQHEEAEALKRRTQQQAQQEAEQILAKARQQASHMLSEAESRVRALEKEAEARGLAAGQAQAKQAVSASLEQLKTVFEATHQERQRLLSDVEREVVHLVLDIVRRLLKIEPLINEQVLIRVTRHALEHLGQKLEVVISVHPEDAELLHFSLSQIQDLALDIVIEPDDTLHIGSCRVLSKAGRIDADLNTQFDAIAQSFLAMAEGENHE
jgi:flagellar assembly protein FliH